tara:strand:- start:17 stop:334 length:318 start_codon:yes stop_codon:yes gene_type:complete
LASWKNIDIWPSYAELWATIWANVFDFNSAIYWLIRLKILMGTQKTIIHRLVMRNRDFDAFLKKKSYFGRKMSVGSLGTKGSGASRPDQTVGPPDGPFGSTIIPP